MHVVVIIVASLLYIFVMTTADPIRPPTGRKHMLIATPQNPLTQLLAPTGNRSMDHAKLHWAIIALAPLLTSTGMFLTQYQTEDGARLVASPSQTFPATPPYTEFTDVDTSSSTSHGDEEE